MLDSTKFLTPEEDAHLAKHLARSKCRDSLIFSLLRRYGMRSNELLRIRPCDLNHSTKSMRVPGSKGSYPREFPLPDDLWERLKAAADETTFEDFPIFDVAKSSLRRTWAHWRPAKKGLHSLRHTCGLELYQKTKDIILVQKVLGHKNIQNTMVYLNFSYTQDQFRSVFLNEQPVAAQPPELTIVREEPKPKKDPYKEFLTEFNQRVRR